MAVDILTYENRQQTNTRVSGKSKEINLTQYTDHLTLLQSDMDSIDDAVSTL